MGRTMKMLSQFLFLLLHFQFHFTLIFSSCHPKHKAALLEFKNTISLYDNCGVFASSNAWNESMDCCSWEGVTCNKSTGFVIGIELSDSCLDGTLPSNSSLFQLQTLQWLDLSFNRLYGPLLENGSPFHLQALQRLNLSSNQFNGSISSDFFKQLVSLTHLDLSGSGFSGLIPSEISLLSKLVSLDLSHGSYPNLKFDAQGFDMFVRNLTKLRNLNLDLVDMSDVEATSFQNLSSYLEILSLNDCQLGGEFPSEVFSLPYLHHVDLRWNENLTGYFPKTNLSSALNFLDLSFCNFKGSIPASFGNLTQLTFLDFSENDFGGQIPDVFGNFNKLTNLNFGSCNFSGQLPKSMFNLTQLTLLDLSHNQLEGPLPIHVNIELQLLDLFLSNNFISGRIPSWLFTLPSLRTLDLSHNKLTGPFDLIQNPNSLLTIDLSFNDIHGQIPTSFFDLVNISSLHLSSNNLSGVIESNMLAKLTSLYRLDLSNNSLLSLSSSNNDVNYSFPQLGIVLFSSCSIRQFPSFLKTSNLVVLDLSNNKIQGISKWEAEGWEQLSMLNLSHNSLTTLEQFPGKNLVVVDLHSNLLQGQVILSTFFSLQSRNPAVFIMSDNKLTGNISSLICNWSSLIVLDLSRNNLSGIIPECLGNLSYGLTYINLEMNNFHGKIPDSFTDSRLSHLLLNDNQLEGSLPQTLANCSSLQVLNLGNNKLTDNFPYWLASLPNLQVLILRNNRFHGAMSISEASFNFSSLRIIDLSHNEFIGPLPGKLFQNLRAMKVVPKETPGDAFLYKGTAAGVTYVYYHYQTSVNITTKRQEIELVKTLSIFVSMDFSDNQFSGGIPYELGQLISLQALNFSNNKLSGPIPPSLANMVALESLDLSSNKLGGRIPSELTNLTFLAVLNLSENELVGPIPNGMQFATFGNDSYSGNLGLCGFPLSKQCGNNQIDQGPKPGDEHQGSAIEIPFIWTVVMMRYGCGVVFGLSMGYIIFTIGRPWWIVVKIERDWQDNVTNWIRRIRASRNFSNVG